MIFYHGTKVKPEVIFAEGLKPCQTDLLKCEGLNSEIDDHIRRKRECMFVYLTDKFEEALGYARTGSNFESNVRLELGWGKLDGSGYVYVIDIPIVAKGEIPVKHVPPNMIMSVEEIGNDVD